MTSDDRRVSDPTSVRDRLRRCSGSDESAIIACTSVSRLGATAAAERRVETRRHRRRHQPASQHPVSK